MTLTSRLNRLADQCVKCGLCLPHCPTYQASLTENESPRGRIALLQALANGQLARNAHLVDHIDRCLLCRNCEKVCPSGVHYGELYDLGQQLLAIRPGLPGRAGLQLLRHAAWLRVGGWLLYLLQRGGLVSLARVLHLDRLSILLRRGLTLPPLSRPRRLARYYSALGEQRGHVALFTGCISAVTDRATLQATISVLQKLGYAVSVPPRQQCCGALHAHSGDMTGAGQLTQHNLAAFAGQYDALLFTASGCGAQLLESAAYQPLRTRVKIQDAVSFIAECDWPASLDLKPLSQSIAVHEPCSARNVLRNTQSIYRLLQRIPGLQVMPLPDAQQCCGAAGSYLLRHPRLADQLRENKLASVRQHRPDRIVTTNIGCALHLQSGLNEQALAVPVQHPLVLVAECLP